MIFSKRDLLEELAKTNENKSMAMKALVELGETPHPHTKIDRLSLVEVRKDKKTETILIVPGVIGAKLADGKVTVMGSLNAPLGKKLKNRKAGDRIRYNTPSGIKHAEITAVA